MTGFLFLYKTEIFSLSMKKGDTVSVIDEDVTGIVEKVKGAEVWVSVDGFTLQYSKSELVVIKSFSNLVFKKQDVDAVLKQKTTEKSKKTLRPKKKKKEKPAVEIDLHIHNLVPSTKGMSNFDMLNLQLDTARHRLEHAIANRIPRLIFIHGIGEGVLRMELEYLFGRYPEITFYDAEYSKYGAGATEVYIYQNPKK